ncbi:MAG: ArsR family transcriptional regulator [Bacteroidia bacterium]|nr:ArsR family transcriptional regulator [Bacteroidia bacterium]MCF8445907.1 ArsR family transcriptional regulator [Bacteroidia bacterium]
MLDALITSKTRIKLLLKFFLNSSKQDYLRNLESELGDNTNSIRLELNKLEAAGLLKSFSQGNKKIFQSNTEHPLFGDINSILMKITGLDQLISRVLNNVGELNEVYLTGDLAQGNDSELIDLILVGDINREYFSELVIKAEKYIQKKIRFVVFQPQEFRDKRAKILQGNDLLLWEK